MKILIINNNTTNKLEIRETLANLLEIPCFISNNPDINYYNKIVKENKEWILETSISDNFSVIASQATSIIYLDFNNSSKELSLYLNKYPSKFIILKNKKEIKKLIIALEKGYEC